MLKRIGDIVLIQLSELDSNIYLVGDTIIDSGTGNNFARLYSMLKALKMSFDSVKQVINTHGHFDHIGGNGYFMKAKIAVHQNDAPILETGNLVDSMADFFDGKLKARKPDTLLKENDRIKVGSHELQVLHTPGHTPGSICLFDKKAGILFSGDTVFSNGVGRTDVPGGDAQQLSRSLEKIIALKPDKLLPGHGEPILSGAAKVISKLNVGAESV